MNKSIFIALQIFIITLFSCTMTSDKSNDQNIDTQLTGDSHLTEDSLKYLKLSGTWLNLENELINIRKDRNRKFASDLLVSNEASRSAKLKFIKDTLSFQYKYSKVAQDYEKNYVDRYDFLIEVNNDSILKIKPVSKLSKEFFPNKDFIELTKQEYLVDNTIKFEKLIFHTSRCYGSCPVLHLEVDSTKHIKLYKEVILEKQSFNKLVKEKIGYYNGELSNKEYSQLKEMLSTCNLRNIEFDGMNCCDGSIITIIVYYNGERKYLKSMFPPAIASKLISYLYYICNKENLKKTDEQFIFES